MYKIETERLVIRPYTDADAPLMVAVMNNWNVARYTRIPYPFTLEHALSFINQDRNPKDVVGGIFQSDTDGNDMLIGGIGLHNSRQPEYELGYWIAEHHWGNGYAYEAGKAVLQYGINARGIDTIFASFANANPKSGRILEKLGFTIIGPYYIDTDENRQYEGKMTSLDTQLYKAS